MMITYNGEKTVEIYGGGLGEQSSFDHPTNILLSGMKIGVNHRIGRNWTFSSWLRDDNDPAPRAFTLE
ncbi:hypothetical protein ACS0TY_011434 [Phlomoides rotata]